MLPTITGTPNEAHIAEAARRESLASFVAAGRAVDANDVELREMWPADATDLTALSVLADKLEERDARTRAEELRDVVAFARWADTPRLWRGAAIVPLDYRAAQTRQFRTDPPRVMASVGFDRLPQLGAGPEIALGPHEGEVARAVSAVLAGDPDIFARTSDGAIIYVHGAPDGAGLWVSELTPALLTFRAADAVSLTRNGNPASLPGRIATGIVDDRDRQGYRRLNGVVDHPVVAVDGTIVDHRQYHVGTGLIVCPPPGLVLDVPEDPTIEDARKAVDELLAVVVDFPFVAFADKAAWLAGLVSPLIRPMYAGPTPWIVAMGNHAGVGKGLVLDVQSLILCGRPFARSVWSQSIGETKQTIDQMFRAGASVRLFDNLTGRVGNAAFDAALTSTRWACGEVEGPLRTVWYATGNCLEWGADTDRRVLPIRLCTECESPESRSGFRHPELEAYVLVNRGRLLSAALTLVRAWVDAGRPCTTLRPWGSYNAWSAIVRQMIVWVGLPDPIETRPGADARPPDDGARVILDAVRYLSAGQLGPPEQRGVTALAVAEATTSAGGQTPEWRARLAEALQVGSDDEVTAKAVARYLHQLQGRVVDGRVLAHAVDGKGNLRRGKEGMYWTVVHATSEAEAPGPR